MIVLDTHALIWWVGGQGNNLGADAITTIALERSQGEILISSMSSWEIAMLVARGRLRLAAEVASWLRDIAQIDHVRFVPVDNAIAVAANSLPGQIHRDPADRIIVATALHFEAALVTGDRALQSYPHVRTIW